MGGESKNNSSTSKPNANAAADADHLKHNTSAISKNNSSDTKNNNQAAKKNNNSEAKNHHPDDHSKANADHASSQSFIVFAIFFLLTNIFWTEIADFNKPQDENCNENETQDCLSWIKRSMATFVVIVIQGEGGTLSSHGAAQPSSETEHSLDDNKVFKSGSLFLSSKGIGWTSWKKRWFVLTQTSLVFFRSDPNTAPQKGCEANLTLGGIDLNSSGSVVVKADKKLLTVSFPDGRDGRCFTLKAETTEDLNEWKTALDEALANAPSASPKAGPAGTVKNEKGNTADGSSEQSKDRSPDIPKVLGRPILLALEDEDGTPSFLEKALRYVEDYGVKVEGILRQAADVEDVERRMREYEQGKVDFNEDEDAHVIGDCIKYVLRELPSSPVPASCCNALLDAYKTDRSTRVSAMRAAVCDTFPEPNRRLLQRILIMMETVADNKNVNRMSVSAVAACMAPLLLRPILACECNLDSQFNMGGGDGSDQLMQAAAAANHAQAIVITLLEEYDNIFGEGDMLSDMYTDSEDLGSEELSEDDYDNGEYSSEGSEHASTSSHSGGEGDGDGEGYQKKTKGPSTIRSHTISHRVTDDRVARLKSRSRTHARSVSQVSDSVSSQINDHSTGKTVEHVGHHESDSVQHSTKRELDDNIQRSSTAADSHTNTKHTTSQQTDAKKQLPKIEDNESEDTKEESKAKTEAEELLSKTKALEAHRQHLKQEVARLEEKLQKELELRKKLETGIMISQQALFSQFPTDEKAESDVISISKKYNDLELQSSNAEKENDDNEATVTSQESKDTQSNKHQVHSYSTKLPPHKQLDPTRSSKETSSSKDMKRSSTNKPKRLNSRNETTGSTMSKITNGLNFLKEKSNHLADELQSMKSQKHTRKGSQDEFDMQSSGGPGESQHQHLDSHVDSSNVQEREN
ncbi:uncharacterized protein LOC143541370 [Bidens hawaiensis]|uniref:uncharacterized protein LOC143541370 n=1 Tax=Bidens hawaiensis TaxID=980011 RepID=UPI004049FA6F